MATHAWYTLSQTTVFETLKSRKTGLTNREVAARQKRYGFNTLPEERRASWFFVLIRQFRNWLVYILLFAAIISLALGELVDMWVILAAVLINMVVGFIQENRAMRAMDKLRKVVSFQAIVTRDGEERSIEVKDLVPGDIVLLEPGDKVPADLRIFEESTMRVNEAKLTGESRPVEKDIVRLKSDLILADQVNMAFMGTVVVSGSGRGIVCQTGITTELGQIAQMIKEAKKEQTPLQERLDRMSKALGGTIIGLSVLIMIFGMLAGHEFVEMFTTAVAIAVAAIPEGLAVAVTVILAIGMQRILKQKGLVRKLVAAETLGSTTVICTDKTGTLTEGEMRVVRVITNNSDFDLNADKYKTHLQEIGERSSYLMAMKIGVLCNDAHIENEYRELEHWKIFGNPTEKALILAGSQIGLNRSNLEKVSPRLATIPFSSEKKFMMTLHQGQKKGNVVYLKGAPEKVLGMSGRVDLDGHIETMNEAKRKNIIKRVEHLSTKGLRIMALGYKPVNGEMKNLKPSPELYSDFVFVGLIGIKDPLRAEAKDTIKLCKKAGIKIVMITGDHKLTAQAIAQELGLEAKTANILEGKDLASMNQTDLRKRVRDITVYARVSPRDKLRIIDAWQAEGEVVAMTGDGVNDAPALRSADIGVAVGSGTDIAKETADLIILDDNFQTIVAAVKQGRVIFDNIKKVILYLLSDGFSEVVVISIALLFGLPLPLVAAQILWINLVTDGFPDIALTMEPEEREVMDEAPLKRNSPIIDTEMKWLIGLVSLISGFAAFGLFYYFWNSTGDVELARTMVFSLVGVDSLVYVFSCRSLRQPIWRKNPFVNPYLLLAVAAGGALQFAAIYAPPLQNILRTVPLNLDQWTAIAIAIVVEIAVIETVKYVFILRKHHVKAS
ncbi:MAG: HAD-IC family P-type ATPase [bacterium]|nr:HAD-IC family P-type ATPase [bacterium]